MHSIKANIRHETIVKKSRFIAVIMPVSDEETIKDQLVGLRKTYPGANHYTYAYRLGDEGQIQKASDDGEPTRTAGYPILEVLLKQDITDVLLVVIRYFGGIKLGAGGLIRAYAHSAASVVALATLTKKRTTYRCRLVTTYDELGTVDAFIREKTDLIGVTYDQTIIFEFEIEASRLDEVREQLFHKNRYQDTLEIIDSRSEYA